MAHCTLIPAHLTYIPPLHLAHLTLDIHTAHSLLTVYTTQPPAHWTFNIPTAHIEEHTANWPFPMSTQCRLQSVRWSAVQCSQCSAVQCSAVQCSAVQCRVCSAVQCSAVQCSAVQQLHTILRLWSCHAKVQLLYSVHWTHDTYQYCTLYFQHNKHRIPLCHSLFRKPYRFKAGQGWNMVPSKPGPSPHAL